MSSCLGFRRKSNDEDTEALLPKYGDDTSRKRSLHAKMHTYQMLRALSLGYMPSTEQIIINLRTVLASDVLNPENPDLSDSGILLVKYSKRWLQQLIDLFRIRNDENQIQEFIWCASKSKVLLDTKGIAESASVAKKKADGNAGSYSSSF